ncbi:hypothetical protein Atai01_44670 [Amycolatopsis taiwanensis]|uniref:Uncharacterized protein n=1 Tax=Amycolatopsis taiwanensis TaxID=342230 RepID=A0A9W6R208_9PSEU|nr:hypothetical protein Atai01_44670 [Amycolatopsis taiwanensis]
MIVVPGEVAQQPAMFLVVDERQDRRHQAVRCRRDQISGPMIGQKLMNRFVIGREVSRNLHEIILIRCRGSIHDTSNAGTVF